MFSESFVGRLSYILIKFYSFSFKEYKICHLTLSQTTNLRLVQTERADDNFNFVENGRKLFIQIENTVGKGEIARNEQFLLFPVFSKDLYCRHVKTRACLGKG